MFAAVAKKILTRLYRVFVHVYIHHFDKLVAIGAVSGALNRNRSNGAGLHDTLTRVSYKIFAECGDFLG